MKIYLGTGSALYEKFIFWQALRHEKMNFFVQMPIKPANML
ncbi:hypothetical protein CSB69_0939 [Morganella morganii]|nr:hypothetical protein CSB69_0939 [Morganella morganii]